MNNLIGGIIFVGLTVLIRLSKNIKRPMVILLFSTYPTVFISVYHTGGIYSIDILWMIFACIATFMFLDYKYGIFLCSISILFLTSLYIIQLQGIVDSSFFYSYASDKNSTHYFFTAIFIFCLLAVILSVFSINLQKANEKIDLLSKEKIDYLEDMIKEKTHELSSLRSNLAKDFHDEMGNKLASINVLSQGVAHKLDFPSYDEQEIKKMLRTIELRANELYQGTKDFIWSIDYKSDYIEEFFIYMRDFGEPFFHSFDINFYSEKNFKNSLSSRIEVNILRQLILVCKEILTNIVKHANAKEVTMVMTEKEDCLEIDIIDNGNGFDTEKVVKRGINNIMFRIQKIGGRCQLNSSSKGTHYFISIPLSKLPLSI